MSKPTKNEPNSRLEYGLRGSKVPLIYGRVSAPQSNIKQMGIYRTSFIISRKVGQSVFAHFWLNEAETPSVEGSAGSLLFRGWPTPHSSSFPWLGKRASLEDTSERSAVGSTLRILLSFGPQHQRALPWTRQQQLRVPILL